MADEFKTTEDKNYRIVDRADGNGKTIGVFKYFKDAHSDKWEVVRSLVDDWAKTHPNEMREILDEAKRRRAEVMNDYGSASGALKDKGFRNSVLLPVGLHIIIKNNFPEILEDKKQMAIFMKKFPGFKSSNKV